MRHKNKSLDTNNNKESNNSYRSNLGVIGMSSDDNGNTIVDPVNGSKETRSCIQTGQIQEINDKSERDQEDKENNNNNNNNEFGSSRTRALLKKNKQISDLMKTIEKFKKSNKSLEAENERLLNEQERLSFRIKQFKRDHVPKLTVDQTVHQTVRAKKRYMHSDVWYKWLVIVTVLFVLIFCDLLTCCEHTKADYTRQLLSWLDFSRIERLLNRQC